MSDDRIDQILGELQEMRTENRDQGDRLIRIEEQTKSLPDHEARIRTLEQLKWGLPITGMTAIGAMILSAWTSTKGA